MSLIDRRLFSNCQLEHTVLIRAGTCEKSSNFCRSVNFEAHHRWNYYYYYYFYCNYHRPRLCRCCSENALQQRPRQSRLRCSYSVRSGSRPPSPGQETLQVNLHRCENSSLWLNYQKRIVKLIFPGNDGYLTKSEFKIFSAITIMGFFFLRGVHNSPPPQLPPPSQLRRVHVVPKNNNKKYRVAILLKASGSFEVLANDRRVM